ncbi:MAG: hypothetical protein E4G90_07985 [Gemmatimonadales bacterium]|nr:MAG: hypothetical protein E4G90_07985 [Gemmatimonadales bacterium]
MKFPSPDPTQEIRAAYRRLLEQRESVDDPSCPDPEEILALVEARSAEEDRLRTLDHLAQCPQCQRDFSLLRTLADARPVQKLQVRPWMAAAASAVIFFGAGYGVWRGARGEGDAVLRGPESSVDLMSPAAGAVGPGEVGFQWRPIEDAFEYIFEILDQEGQSLLSQATADTSLLLDLGEHPELAGGLSWWVRARLKDGTERSSEVRRLDLPDR